MTLARFQSRIADAVTPLLGSSSTFMSLLENITVSLKAPERILDSPANVSGFLLAVNLCARLYPTLILDVPPRLKDECARLALQVNPMIELHEIGSRCSGSIGWDVQPAPESSVFVSASGWDVHIDSIAPDSRKNTNPLTAMAAGCLAVGELFRTLFGELLPNPRSKRTEARFNLLGLPPGSSGVPDLPIDIPIGRVHLIGAGAIGQSAAYALKHAAVRGMVVVVDPETISLSNLQRYVIAFDKDVGASKCQVIERYFANSQLRTSVIQAKWGDPSMDTTECEVACTALDSVGARIGVQASLPRRIYNAWTQPADLGWSRHEDFVNDPCLACLYYPNSARPSQHQLIARAVRQAELRVLCYLTFKLPVDVPLRPEQILKIRDLPAPLDSGKWVDTPILDDIVEALGLDQAVIPLWKEKGLVDVYREGICGGAIVAKTPGELSADVRVPLAHQSALAGVMLASELVVSSSENLRGFRSQHQESRLDVLSQLPLHVSRPRVKTPGCLCSDEDFVERYRRKWSGQKWPA